MSTYRIGFGLALALALASSGCGMHRSAVADAKDDYLKVSAPPVEGTKTRVQGAAIGALIGGILGVAVAAVTGVDAMPLAAAVGAGAGAVGGLIYAEHVVRQRQDYADASEYIQARTEALTTHVESARQFNDVLESQLTALQADRGRLDAAVEDSSHVRERMQQEISQEQQALAESRLEAIDEDTAREQELRIAELLQEERRLAGHLATMSGQEADTPDQLPRLEP